MKKKEFNELSKKTVEELSPMLAQKKSEVLPVAVSIATGKEKNFKKAKLLRLEIAKISTIIREKQLLGGDDSVS